MSLRRALPSPSFSNIHPGYAVTIVFVTTPLGNVLGGSFTAHVVSPEGDAIWMTSMLLTSVALLGCSLLFDLES